MLLYTLLLNSVALLVHTDFCETRMPVVGGEDADINEFPYIISLRNEGNHMCGGSIYESNIVITAAHCVAEKYINKESLSVAAGSTLLNNVKEMAKIKKVITHENYNESTIENDIAILVLDRHFSFNPDIQPIDLVNERKSNGLPVTIIGWGLTQENGFPSNHLKKVQVNLISNEECQESYSNQVITDRMLCAGARASGKDACSTDSGGPLIYERNLIGIVSFGEGCGKIPGVYASVPDLYDWIIKTVENNRD